MTVLLHLILITSILVLGWTIATQPNMVLHSLRLWAEKKKDEGSGIMEGLFLCHWCMPSTWSLLGYLFGLATGIINDFSFDLLIMYPLVVCGSSIMTGIIWSIYQLISSATEYYKKLNNEIEINENDIN